MAFSLILRYWHLLSLDAPTVAALWTWFVARAASRELPTSLFCALFISVWILYVVDRLLDAHPVSSPRPQGKLSERHLFHRQHRILFLTVVVLSLPVLAHALWNTPFSILAPYLWLAVALFGYCCSIHATQLAFLVPREPVVGSFFAVAVFLSTAEDGWMFVPAALVFSLVCTLNCLFIHVWENDLQSRLAHPRLVPLGTLIALAGIATLSMSSTLYAACGLSILLLLVLHACRSHLELTTLRSCADLTLLTPLLFLSLI